MDGFSFVTSVTGLNRRNTGKKKKMRRRRRRKIWYYDVDCIHLAQNRDQWWAPVNIILNIQVL
jgi:hypothetical protein